MRERDLYKSGDSGLRYPGSHPTLRPCREMVSGVQPRICIYPCCMCIFNAYVHIHLWDVRGEVHFREILKGFFHSGLMMVHTTKACYMQSAFLFFLFFYSSCFSASLLSTIHVVWQRCQTCKAFKWHAQQCICLVMHKPYPCIVIAPHITSYRRKKGRFLLQHCITGAVKACHFWRATSRFWQNIFSDARYWSGCWFCGSLFGDSRKAAADGDVTGNKHGISACCVLKLGVHESQTEVPALMQLPALMQPSCSIVEFFGRVYSQLGERDLLQLLVSPSCFCCVQHLRQSCAFISQPCCGRSHFLCMT